MLISEILDAAADLIEPEGKWAQGAAAYDRDGREVGYAGFDAVCFCITGAIARVCVESAAPANAYPRAASFLRTMSGMPCCLVDWNDDPARTQPEAVAAFRAAAAKARELRS